MITKSELEEYRHFKQELSALARQIEITAEQIETLQGWIRLPGSKIPPTCDEPLNNGNSIPRQLSAPIIKLEELQARLRQRKALYAAIVNKSLNLLTDIEIAVNNLSTEERTLIRLHYFCGLSWNKVAKEMICDRATVFRLRNAALKKLCH